MKNLILIFLSCLPLSCSHRDHAHNNQRQHGVANKHMHQHDHEKLIAAFEDPSRDKWQMPEKVIKFMGPLAGKRIIDIGAGSGYFTEKFLKEKARVVAADVDDKFILHLEKRFPQEQNPWLTIRKIEYDNPRMEKGTFDYAFISNTYHHIEDRVRYLKKIKKGLKIGGKLVVLDFKTDPQDLELGPPLEMRVLVSSAEEEIRAAGFERVHVMNAEFPQQYLILAERKK